MSGRGLGLAAIDRKMLRDLWRMRGQAVAIALVAAAGVAMYVMAAGTFASLSATRDAYYDRYRMPDIFAGAVRAPESAAREIALLSGVLRADSRIVGQATLDMVGVDEPVLARLVSWDPSKPENLGRPYLRAGRLIAPGRPDEGMVSENFATAHGLAPGDKLVATINGQRRTIDIVGIVLSPEFVYAIAPGAIMPDNRLYGIIWLARLSLAATYDLQGAFNELAVSVIPDADQREIFAGVDRILAPFGGVSAYGRTDHMSDAFLAAEIDGLEAMGKVVPPIFLAVAAFLVNIVMSRLIQTERERIGLFKAFGYTNRAIGFHYLKLVSVITAAGALLGMAGGSWLGRAVTEIYGEFFSFPFLLFRPNLSTMIIAAGVTLAAGCLGTVSAIRRAVLLPPAEAMIPPTPPRYRQISLPGAIGRMAGFLSNKLSQPTRMIGRQLLRAWGRGAATCVGISLSVAMLVSTMFFFDAIEVLIDTQFQVGQRQDVSVTFVEATRPDALWSLERLPGVMKAEGFRAVPASVSAGRFSRNVSIIGLPAQSQLQRPLDRRLMPIAIPERGILLSAKLGELLGVGVGDTISVEVKLGARPQMELRVTALADDYIGTSAYMDIASLNRAMGHVTLISGANILLDPVDEPMFFQTVRDMPFIAGVQSNSVALAMFRATMAENLFITIFFYIAFAAIIAVGIVYNAARISLSERARELATLRVLGFSRGEVSYILLGELAVLTVIAMPLGCGLGYLFATGIIELYRTDLMRIPLIVNESTYAVSMLIVLIVTALSGLLVRRQIDQLDLVAVLKTRE